ncbi:MAG TPA: 4-alpha-glucanotransferase [Thermoanaerobaculia bacterium]|nr:4-alpha-glucanotransferase [Thermoanaerobaculia bacterium]
MSDPSSPTGVESSPERRRRRAGILLHPTSLPGPFGVGDLGPAAMAFLSWAHAAGQSVWQVLPLGPTGYGDSPYGLLSSFAGNPFLISPEALVEDGLLHASELHHVPRSRADRVDSHKFGPWKEAILRASWGQFEADAPPGLAAELAAFCAQEGPAWLDDWSLFIALKRRHRGRPWPEWQAPLARREPGALAQAREELAEEIAFHAFVQFLFFRQWKALRRRAAELSIEILGDLPIYVALDSADVWCAPHLFELDARFQPTAVSGVPPDAFTADGQLWGTPVYDWGAHHAEGYAWWAARIGASLRFVDQLRIDHFRGFAGWWRVPADAPTAAGGRWVPGPGLALFQAVAAQLGPLPLIAEDLGVITPDVRRLLADLGVPGMKVLQFAFADEDSDYLPHHYEPHCVVYTGTHDNDTARGWFAHAGTEERRRAADYLGVEGGARIEWAMIRAAYTSVADLAVVPMQDALGLGSRARMNTPGKPGGNWLWRVREEDVHDGTAARLRRLVEVTGRVPKVSASQAEH